MFSTAPSGRQTLLCCFLLFGIYTNGQVYHDSAVAYQIDYVNDNDLTSYSSGVSLADFDGDGRDDITIATGFGDSLVFFRNDPNGFIRVKPNIGNTDEAEHVLWVDYDNDGDKDLYLSAFNDNNRLYRNDGFPNFTDVSVSSGIEDKASHTFGVCWGDYNRDGYLDLYETNRQENNITNQLYESNRNGGFTRVTTPALADSNSRAFAASFFDFNNDNWPDIFLANDKEDGNKLFKNDGMGGFIDVSASAGIDTQMFSMTSTIGDYDNDGYLDIYVTNTALGNVLYHNNGNETFTEVSTQMGVRVNGGVGFIPGSGASISSGTVLGSDSTFGVTGLSAQTDYEFYVQDTCTVGGTGAWIGPFTFTTGCLAFIAPYSQDFEASTNTLPACWDNFSSTGELWQFRNTNLGHSASTGANGSSYFAAFDDSNAPLTSDGTLVTPFVDVSALTTPALYFFLWSDAEDGSGVSGGPLNATITVEVWDGAAWNLLFTNTGNTVGWEEFLIDLSGLNITGPVQARFIVDEDHAGGFDDDISLDDISFRAGPSCPIPSSLTAQNVTDISASLTWLGSPAANNFQIWMGPDGFYQGTQTVNNIGLRGISASDSLYIDTLTEQTCYQYVIRAICSPGDTSDWSSPLSFCTGCTNQLNGTYTINSALPTAGTNFNSFADAGDALSACGVSGPVTFNVAAGTYTDHMHIIDAADVSATKSVMINGNGAEIIYDLQGPQGTMVIDNTGFITVDSLIIRNNKPTEGWGIYITGDSDSLTIQNSIITTDTSGLTNFAADVTPIVVSGDGTYQNDNVYGADVNYLTVDNCQLIGGYQSFSHYSPSTTSWALGTRFTNNIVRNFNNIGMYFAYQEDLVIAGNTIISTISNFDEDGMYVIDCNDFLIENNEIHVKDWGIYMFDANEGFAATQNSIIRNNVVISDNDYAIYLNDQDQTDVYHNTLYGGGSTQTLRLLGPTNTNIKNNILYASTSFALEVNVAFTADVVVDYNLYYSGGAALVDIGPNVYNNLTAWQTADATRNVNSAEGDPVFIQNAANLVPLGSLADDSGEALGVTTDIDGASRSLVTPDIGAYEFTALSGDLALLGAEFLRNDPCYTTNDTIEIYIQNIIGTQVDFTVDPLTINYAVTGPVNSSGTVVTNTGVLPALDSLVIQVTTIDMSVPGNYVLNASIAPNAVNTLAVNDTLAPAVDDDVDSILTVTPSSALVINSTDQVQITATSPFFPGGAFHFTEIMHFNTGTGRPAGGWPAWYNALVGEHVEITGVPNSDLGGYTFEQWNITGGAPTGTYTFPSGTVLNSNGTAIVAMRTVAPSPANFYYDGSGGNAIDWQSNGGQGVILRDPSGNIVDAVGYPNSGAAYVFPAAANVSAADWGGGTPGAAGGTCGIRLTGPDLNDATGWVVSSAANTQDLNVVNAGVVVPSGGTVAGFQWTLNGTQYTTEPDTMAGPYSSSGTFTYIAELMKCGTTYYDTVVVTVIIPTCPTPANAVTISNTTTVSAQVNLDTTGVSGASAYLIEYGPAGFAVGTGVGTIVAVPNAQTATISGLTQNLCQDVYMRVVCTPGDTSFPTPVATMCPDEVPCDDMDAYAANGLSTQSALIIPWQNGGAAAWGDGEFTTAQSQSAPHSLRITDQGTNAVTDIVAYFDTISTGAWKVDFGFYIPTGAGGYYNIQQNHDLTGVANQWNAEVYFQGNGTGSIQYSTGSVNVGTFTYTQGQWNTMTTIVDLTNDSIWFNLNGTTTGLGYKYSLANVGAALQFNGVNFFSGILTGQTYNFDMYVDDFCVTPFTPVGVCADPTALAANVITCDSVELSWTSDAGTVSSALEYGAAGFAPGTGAGTVIANATSPLQIGGLTPGAYEFYVVDFCASDTSNVVGPIAFNTVGVGAPTAGAVAGTPSAATLTSQSITFDGSTSTGAGITYAWDFGDGNTGTGVNPTNVYATNGTWSVKLVVSNNCGSDSVTISVTTMGIGLEENYLSNSLEVFPNPASSNVTINFDVLDAQEATIRLLDLSGKEVYRSNVNNLNGRYQGDLDISQVAEGIYMLEIESGELKATRRVIKQ